MEEIAHDVSLLLKNARHGIHPKAENAQEKTKLKSKFPCLKKKNHSPKDR